MALGVDKTALVLRSGGLFKGTVSNPETIGTDGVNFIDHFSGTQVGSIVRGTQIVNLPVTFVEARVDTPSFLLRKDPTQADMAITGSIYEQDPVILGTFLNRRTTLSYATTGVDGAQTVDIIHIGPQQPPITEAAYLIDTTDVSGRQFMVMMYAGINTAEDQSLTFSGDEYVQTNINLEATVHANFTFANYQDAYGAIARIQ